MVVFPEEITIDRQINYLLYLNEKRQLRKVHVKTYMYDIEHEVLHCKIPERHVICGYIYNGYVVSAKANPEMIRYTPFSPVEKYLIDSSNVNFEIPLNEFRQENALLIWRPWYITNGVFGWDEKNLSLLVQKVSETYLPPYYEQNRSSN